MSKFYSCWRCGEPLDEDYPMCDDCEDEQFEDEMEIKRQDEDFDRECLGD